MWSTIRSPGERRIEMAAAWAALLDMPCDESTNLKVLLDQTARHLWSEAQRALTSAKHRPRAAL
jgi:hypothetical protein